MALPFKELPTKLTELADQPRIGLITGTGWSEPEVLAKHFQEETSLNFWEAGLPPEAIPGHPKMFRLGRWDGVPAVVSHGRLHFNEVCQPEAWRPYLLRTWMAALLLLMGKGQRLIITNLVGGNLPEIKPGLITVPIQLVTGSFGLSHHPWLDSRQGEFVTPESLLPSRTIDDRNLFPKAVLHGCSAVGLESHNGPCRYVMIGGPGFGSKGDRALYKQMNIHTVGMSVLPELGLVCVHNQKPLSKDWLVRVGVVQLVSDNEDCPSHDGNQNAAQELAPKLGDLLTHLVHAKW